MARLHIIVAILLFWATAYAQNDTIGRLNRSLVLELEYTPAVRDANKLNFLPYMQEPKAHHVSADYATAASPLRPESLQRLLPVDRESIDSTYDKRRGYLHLNGGMYAVLHGDFGYHLLHSASNQLAITLSHHSANGKASYPDYPAPAGFSGKAKPKLKWNDNQGAIAYRHLFTNGIAFRLGGSYAHSTFNYYGLPPVDDTASDTDSAHTPTADLLRAYAGITSAAGERFTYCFDAGYRRLAFRHVAETNTNGTTDPTEQAFDIALDAGMNFNNQRLGLRGALEGINYSGEADNLRTHTTLAPYYQVGDDGWRLRLGVQILTLFAEKREARLAPDVEAEWEVGDRTALYAVAGGAMQANSLYHVARINRYVHPNFRLAPSYHLLDGRLGVRSNPFDGFRFDAFTGYRITENDFFFLPYGDVNAPHRYTTLGGIDTRLFLAGIQCQYNYRQALDLYGQFVYNHWTASGMEHAYNHPQMELTAGVNLRSINKVILALDYRLAAKRYTNYMYSDAISDDSPSTHILRLKNLSELNLTASYLPNKTIQAYVKLNNLLDRQQELYYGYPLLGFHALLGVNLSF